MKTVYTFISILFLINLSSSKAQYAVKGTQAWYCPEATLGDPFTLTPSPLDNCTIKWEIINGVIYDGVYNNKTSITGTNLINMRIKWNNVQFSNKIMPKGRVNISSSNCPSVNCSNDFIIFSLAGVIPNEIKINQQGGGTYNLPYSSQSVNLSSEPLIVPNLNTYVERYEWTLPSGWKTDNNESGVFETNAPSITVIPSSCTGGVVKLRGVNKACGAASGKTFFSDYRTLTVNRVSPNISVTSSTNSVMWGTSSIISFTATYFSGADLYEWTLPTGWRTLDGASGTITTTSNIIELISSGCNEKSISVRARICEYYTNVANAPSFTINYPNLSGPEIVCSSAVGIIVNNTPSNSTFSWNYSNNLSLISTANNIGYFSSYGNGSGSVQATAYSNSCIYTTPVLKVWVGVPSTPAITASSPIYYDEFGRPNVQVLVGKYLNFYASTALNDHSSYFKWINMAGNLSNQGKPNITVTYPTGPLVGSIKVSAQNSCGWSPYSDLIMVNVVRSLILTPNPSSDYFEVLIGNEEVMDPASKLKKSEINAKVQTYIVNILDNQGVQVQSFQIKGNRFNVPVTNLKNGTYIIVVKNGNDVYTDQFVVEHK